MLYFYILTTNKLLETEFFFKKSHLQLHQKELNI